MKATELSKGTIAEHQKRNDPHHVPGLNLVQTFQKLGNKKNKLTRSNFSKMLKSFGCKVDKITSKNIFDEVDFSRTGYITIGDFQAFVTLKEHDIDDIANDIQIHVSDFGKDKEDGMKNIFGQHSSFRTVQKKNVYNYDSDDDDEDGNRSRNSKKKIKVLEPEGMRAMAHQVVGMLMTHEESIRLLHRFDYSSTGEYITYNDFSHFLSYDNCKQRIVQLKEERVIKCATVLVRYLQRVAEKSIRGYKQGKRSNQQNDIMNVGAKAAWNALTNGNSNKKLVTNEDLKNILKVLHVEELADDNIVSSNTPRNTPRGRDNNSSTNVGTPRGGISVDIMSKLRQVINPTCIPSDSSILDFNSMCTFASVGMGSQYPINDIFISRSLIEEKEMFVKKGWYRSSIGQIITTDNTAYRRSEYNRNNRDNRNNRNNRNNNSTYEKNEKNENNNMVQQDVESTRISIWVKRKSSKKYSDDMKDEEEDDDDNNNNNQENDSRRKRKRNKNKSIRRICIGTHPPTSSNGRKGCRWIQSNEPIYTSTRQHSSNSSSTNVYEQQERQKKNKKKDRWLWYTKDTPTENEDEQIRHRGSNTGGVFDVVMDLELTTSVPVTNNGISYLQCYGANPNQDISIEQPFEEDVYHYNNSSYGNVSHESSNVGQSDLSIIPLYVHYNTPDNSSFVKSGMPDGMEMNGNNTKNDPQTDLAFKTGDRVYVGLPSRSSKDGFRWMGPGEITSQNRTTKAFNVYLDSGEKMENVTTNRLKHTTLSNDNLKGEVESISTQKRTRRTQLKKSSNTNQDTQHRNQNKEDELFWSEDDERDDDENDLFNNTGSRNLN